MAGGDDSTYPGAAPYDSATDCMTDYDEDGYGDSSPASGVTAGTDCDDDLDSVNPGHTFDWVDGADNQCDGDADTFDLSNADTILYGTTLTDPLTITRGGDVDGDGQIDLILADPAESVGPYPSAGAVYLFTSALGSSPVSMSSADATLTGTDAHFEVGASLAGAGNINSDGYADLLVGAPGEDTHGTDAGMVYLIAGSSSPASGSIDTIATQVFLGADVGDRAGTSVAWVEDMDADGLQEVLIGAPYHDPGSAASAGAVYMVWGSAYPSTPVDLGSSSYVEELTGSSAGDLLGWSVSNAGQVNGDDVYPDLIVGAPGVSSSAGAAYLVWGDASGGLTLDVALTGISTGDQAGYSVCGDLDLNGDGYMDLVVGAPGVDVSSGDEGAAYIIFGAFHKATLASASLGSPDAKVVGTTSGDALGTWVAPAGNVNADTDGGVELDDLLVGVASYDKSSGTSTTDFGAGYLIRGSTSLSGTITDYAPLIGTASGDEAGTQVHGVGDYDGDGYDDFFISSEQAGTFFLLGGT